MRPRTITVQAGDAQDALVRGAQKLGTVPENLTVRQAPPNGNAGAYQLGLLNCDAEVDIELSLDGMTATITQGLPALGTGRALDGPKLIELLQNWGVRIPPDVEAARKIISTLSRGGEVSNVVIARGIPAEPAQDADVEPLGDWNFPVFPGDGVGRLIRATLAKPGKSLAGEPLQPTGPDRGRSLNLLENGGCFIDQTSLVIRADRYGLVVRTNQDLYISSGSVLKVNKTQMEVQATIFPKDFRDAPITLERMRSALEGEGITAPLDEKGVRLAIEQAVATGVRLKDVVICRGQEPKDGADGWFEMLFKDERPNIGVLDEESGRMDFRARGMVRSVKKDEVLGRLHPPQQGLPGRDVYGKIIPAREGRPFNMQLSGNVQALPEGNVFAATEDGMVFFVGNTLSVTDVFTTPGNVDMKTGNISIEKGSVHVRGSVLSGFSVQSPGNVLVNDVIENARVSADGDIEVRGGILMDRSGGKVAAKGGVSALFAKNATIVAGGDVNIAHEVSNCIVFAGNKVIAVKGRGKIIGSTVRAGKGVEANEIGTELGVETTIFLGVERRSFSEELANKRKLQDVLHRIYGSLGTDDPRAILARTPPDKRQAVTSLLKARVRAEKMIKDIEDSLEQERERIRRAVQARVKVRKVIHPGTIINCFGSTLKITEPVQNCQLYYDPKEQKVVVAPL